MARQRSQLTVHQAEQASAQHNGRCRVHPSVQRRLQYAAKEKFLAKRRRQRNHQQPKAELGSRFRQRHHLRHALEAQRLKQQHPQHRHAVDAEICAHRQRNHQQNGCRGLLHPGFLRALASPGREEKEQRRQHNRAEFHQHHVQAIACTVRFQLRFTQQLRQHDQQQRNQRIKRIGHQKFAG